MCTIAFVVEAERQCQLALAAAEQMAENAGRFWPIADSPSVIGDFFDHAQRFWNSAGILGKIFYARGTPRQLQRAEQLRAALGLPDVSPLADWTVRNGLEHIDERIDAWAEQNPGAISYSRTGISRTGEAPPEPVMRHYDSMTDELSVWGKSVQLEPAVAAVRDIQERVRDSWRRHGGADPAAEAVDRETASGSSEAASAETDLARSGITITSVTSAVVLRDL